MEGVQREHRRHLKTPILLPRMRNVATPAPLYLRSSRRSTNHIIIIIIIIDVFHWCNWYSLVWAARYLSTIGDRAFPVATACIRNSLLNHFTSAPSMGVFRPPIKCHLLSIFFPSTWLYSVRTCHFGHVNHSSNLLILLPILKVVSTLWIRISDKSDQEMADYVCAWVTLTTSSLYASQLRRQYCFC